MAEQPIDTRQLTIEERRVLGRSQRKQVPRRSHAEGDTGLIIFGPIIAAETARPGECTLRRVIFASKFA